MAARESLAFVPSPEEIYEHEDTLALVALVKAAAELVGKKGEASFDELRVEGSRWRKGETYIFVLDPDGNMLVHPDPKLEGKNQLELTDIHGKPIIRGLLASATAVAGKPGGWYHYQWPVPGGLLPRWKSSYVRLVKTSEEKRFIVGCGVYNDRMEKAFVVDSVRNAVALLEAKGDAALALFHDPKEPFLAKDSYIFVYDMNGNNLAFPAFPNLEGKNLLDWKDPQGTYIVHEVIKAARRGSGWIEYLLPKPGESVSTKKSSFVSRAKMGEKWVAVGCGVYFAGAPTLAPVKKKMTARELMALVREGATLLGKKGEAAFGELRQKGSKWFHDEIYFFVWSRDGTRVLHVPDPSLEGRNATTTKDILGRPYGKMILEAADEAGGEGWVHYMYPEPGNIFPAWKSTFVKRVKFPSGVERVVGCGLYHMQMDRAFIEDLVNRASALVEKQGRQAFPRLRDKTGPFVFMDTYVFVTSFDGTELVNAGFPSLEGHNLLDVKDLNGKSLVRDEIELAQKQGKGWIEAYWYAPGKNVPAFKQSYIRKVQVGGETFVVGSGVYLEQAGSTVTDES